MSAPTLLVSAGPSREFIDDVRFLSNPSTGSMGIAVAEAAAVRGWAVYLALGPTSLNPDRARVSPSLTPGSIVVRRFVSACDLDAIAAETWPDVDAFVATAAVCDYRPAERIAGKRKKKPGDWSLSLVRNPDVLRERSQRKGPRSLVGFALEATPDVAEARRKLVEKQLDLIILNSPANFGSLGDDAGSRNGDPSAAAASVTGDYTWIESSGVITEMPHRTKVQLASDIVHFLSVSRDTLFPQ